MKIKICGQRNDTSNFPNPNPKPNNFFFKHQHNTHQEKPTKMTTMLTATTTGGGGKASSLTCLHHSSSSSSSSLPYTFSTALHFKKFPHQVFCTSKLTNNTHVLVDDSASDASSSSASTSRRSADWKAAKAYKQSGFVFEGRIEGYNGGGFLVRFFSLLGFLPFPQLSPSHSCKDADPQKSIHEVAKSLNGSRISVKIIQADEEKRKLIFSEKEASWTKYSNKVNVGDVFLGKVGTVEDYGAFIHLRFPDGLYHLTGLVHVSEVSWDLVQDIRDVLNEGDDVRVKVIRVDREKSRITLSIKQLEEDPLLETLDKVIPQDDSGGSDSSSTDNGSDIEPLPGLAAIFEELLQEDGIDDVRITRQGFEKRVVSQDLQLWLSNAPPTERKFTLLARAGRQVQEIQVTTFLDQEGIKKALQRVLERVP